MSHARSQLVARLTLLATALTPSLVVAHGCQKAIQFGDNAQQPLWDCQNMQVAQASGNTFTRQFNGDGPIFAFDKPEVSCNKLDNVPAKPANGTAPAKAGDKVQLWMTPWVEGPAWLHWGPINVYMAYCGDAKGSCSTFDSTTPNAWFKIYEAGFTNGKWASQVMGENNSSFSFTLPKNIRDGEYLVRPEVLSLQFGRDPNGAQLFMECHQISFTGGKSCEAPSGNYMASFPGSYDMKQPAFRQDIWTDKRQPNLNLSITGYVNPGPPLFPDTCGPAGGAVVNGLVTSIGNNGTVVVVPVKAVSNAAVIGGTVGGIVGFIGLLLCIWCCCYRRRSEEDVQQEKSKQMVLAAAIRHDRDSKDRDSASCYAATPAKLRPPTTPVYRAPSEYASSQAAYPGGASDYYAGQPGAYGDSGSFATPPAYVDPAYAPSSYAASSHYHAPAPASSYAPAASEYAASSAYAPSNPYGTPPTDYAPSSVMGQSAYEYASPSTVANPPPPRRKDSSRSSSKRDRRDRERDRDRVSDKRPWATARSVSATNAQSHYAASDAHFSSHPDDDQVTFYH